MSDIVTCKAVLSRSVDPTRPDYLHLVTAPNDYRAIPCKPKGRQLAAKYGRPSWQYEERGGRLHITPSLLCTNSGFHTAGNWDVAFAECPEDRRPHDFFFELNPELAPK